MQTPAEVSFLDLPVSAEAEREILRHSADLERFYGRITSCRVIVSAPHRRQRRRPAYEVRIELTVPGARITVGREPDLEHAHEDLRIAIRGAFRAARRRLQDHVRRARGFVKHHAEPLPEPPGELQ